MGQGGLPSPPGAVTCGWLVAGQVQGVGFRYFVQRRATALGLTGWVRNLPDGRVEVLGQGPEPALEALEGELARGPQRAIVTGVTRHEISDQSEHFKSFDIR